jgi:diacylglycerol kinase (ATP)
MAWLKSLLDLRRIVRAAGYSAAGLKAALRGETAFRQELALFVVLAPLGLWLGSDGVERALLLGSLLLVLVVELLNSAIEAAINRIGAERNELSGLAKDLGSAAVFVSLLIAVAVWALVLADSF